MSAGAPATAAVDRLDIEIDELVRVLARGLDLGADGRIAQHGDRHLVELHVAAAGLRQIRDLLAVDLGEIGKEGARIGIDGRIGKIGAAIEMHGRGRRHGDLARHLRHLVQEFELVRRQRLGARELGGGIGRREVDLVAVIVAELEHRRLDGEALAAGDEPTPVGAATELAVGHDLEPGILLQLDHVSDRALLDLDERGAGCGLPPYLRKASRSSLGRSRLPT